MQQHPKDPPSSEDAVSRRDLNQTREEILEYWTKERMAEARPRELRLPEPGPPPADQD
ncbi:hypothetical protein [Arthrobacter sp. W4I7]|uniref:hypothetical protein n=1 Tax=Arthrobacter sp. W4I7 TaxID=3042296 RepID=UPI00278016C3|nr:hypothetical protein [Arthrobacter sp. W4I7]MDQ0692036.1 hypothetical protein [Arthrobacter sp. W4I7]